MRQSIVIPPGVISDDTTFAAGPRYVDASGIRFWRGLPQVDGGFVSLTSDLLTGVCRNVLPFTTNEGANLIAFGTHSALMIYTGDNLADVTPVGLADGPIDGVASPGFGTGAFGEGDYGESGASEYFARTWSLSAYGETLMANPRAQTIFWWQGNPAVPAAALTNAPAQVTAMLVTPERQVLAFGCNEEVSTNFNPMCIRGSDIEDPTDWTTSATNNAFEEILGGGGRIVTARMFGTYVAVWTDNAVYLGEFIGLSSQTYRFNRVADNCGLAAPNAVAIMNGTAYWLGKDLQFRAWTLGGVPTIIECPIRNNFKDNIASSQGDKIVATTISQYGEIRWFYPDKRDGTENSRYLILSTIDATWAPGILARTAFHDAATLSAPIGVTVGGQIYYHETGDTADGAKLDWFLKTGDFYINDAQDFLLVKGIWPDFEEQRGSIDLTAYARKYPQSDPVTKGPYRLVPGASKKDFMFSARVVSLKWEGASNPNYVRFGKPSFEAERTGQQ